MPVIRGLARLPWLMRVPRSLGAKLVLILTGIGMAGSLAITVLLAAVITPSFNRLEQVAVDGHVERTRAALDDFAREVETAVRDYGDWTASYDYMAAPSRAFEEESFSTLAMANLDVHGMAYVAADRRVVIARWLDLEARRDVPAMRARLIAAASRLRLDALLRTRSSHAFYLKLGDRLVAVGAAQVRRSDGTGSPRGYVLMARELTSAQMANLLQLPARVDLAHPVATTAVSRRQQTLGIAVPIPGPDGRAVASTAFAVPRDLSMLGRRMLLLAVGGAVLLLAIVLVMLRRMITRLVLRPLHLVEQHMALVRNSGAITPLTGDPREDEIGSLQTGLNAMLRQLKDLREQLEMQSFRLGQSESAVAVMHNVRNALNPISTILSQGVTAVPSAERASVERALGELAREDVPAVRRRKLAAFVAAAANADEVERAQHRRSIEIGRKALHNVLEIIGRQQEQAHEKPALSACDLSDIVEQNAAIARYAGDVSIAFEFPAAPHWGMANRVILSQVVGNLLANAAEAIVAAGGEGGSIAITIEEREGRVELIIRDNGEGFDPGDEPRFFQRGFSTRAHKAGGLGLHWCANAMQAMGGALSLESDGRDAGARAVLTLQAARVEGLGQEAA